jgi:P-type Ca2+ transporter type 2C
MPICLDNNLFFSKADFIGLAATVTSVLTLVARRLEKKQVYIKRLDIVEALGSASIIASDKTGTLTKNVMTVTDVWYNDEVISGTVKKLEGIPERGSVKL